MSHHTTVEAVIADDDHAPPLPVVHVKVSMQCVRHDDAAEPLTPKMRIMGGLAELPRHHQRYGSTLGTETPVICFEEAPLFERCTICRVGPEGVLAIPTGLSLERACAALPAALRAVSALLFRVPPEICRGGSILVVNGDEPSGYLASQLAFSWGAGVILIICRSHDVGRAMYAEVLPSHHVVLQHDADLLANTMRATSGAGADIILDLADPNDSMGLIPVGTLLRCLAVSGHLCSSRRLDLIEQGIDTELLRLKNASVHLLQEDIWFRTPKIRGRLLHIIPALLDLLARGDIVAPRPQGASLVLSSSDLVASSPKFPVVSLRVLQ